MLALIAGQGALPKLIAPKAKLIAALAGNPPDLRPDLTFRLEHLGTFLKTLADKGATEVCFAGAVRRPAFDPSQIDSATLPLVAQLQATFAQGDDAALKTVLHIFETAGFTIRAPHELAPELLPTAGVLSKAQPDEIAVANAGRAARVLAALGPADVGQGCAVHKGQIIAVEAAFGTEWMLASLASRPDGKGGLFYKAPKPQQDRRVDMPTIGPDTITAVANAGLQGITIEAGGVIVLDRAETITRANHHGLFLWVKDP